MIRFRGNDDSVCDGRASVAIVCGSFGIGPSAVLVSQSLSLGIGFAEKKVALDAKVAGLMKKAGD